MQLGPPQFGLRTMLLIVSSVAVLLGLSQWMSPISFAALILLILSIIAHVAGNVIGTRLKSNQRAKKKEEPTEPRTALQNEHFAPTTKLGGRQSLGWLPLGSGLGGFVLGASLGSAWTAYLLSPDFDAGTLALAAVAFGALGGIGGFLVVGFTKAFWDAWEQASN
jgi:hypothetical protein